MAATTLELTAADARLVVDLDAGGRLASLRVAGAERLVTSAPPGRLEPIMWGCYLMAPWAGRLGHGRVPLDGVDHRVPPTYLPDHPVHGLVLDRPWQVESADDASAALRCALPDDRPPFAGTVRQQIRLSADGLTLAAQVRAARRMPAALGWHPWFRRPDHGDLVVRVDADEVLVTDEDLVPTGARAPVGTRSSSVTSTSSASTRTTRSPWSGRRNQGCQPSAAGMRRAARTCAASVRPSADRRICWRTVPANGGRSSGSAQRRAALASSADSTCQGRSRTSPCTGWSGR